MNSNTPVNITYQANSFVDSRPRAEFLSGRARFLISRELQTSMAPADLVPGDYELVYDGDERHCRDLWFTGPRGGLLLEVSPVGVRVAITGEDRTVLDGVMADIHDRAGTPTERGRRTSVWWSDENGPSHTTRRLDVETWDAVAANYPLTTRSRLTRLMTGGAPTQSGRLLLWHGEPGTGKTSATLALVDAWYGWCDAHVITDPERMFTDSGYLMQVLTAPSQLVGGGVDLTAPVHSRWKLVICEDADEYLRSDARARSGPALGRLLNATDGLLGRGTNTLILLTTNDELGRLHPAVTRPGRCLDLTEFPRFSSDEAAAWLGAPAPAGGATLAELFQLREGTVAVREPERVGAYL